MAHVQAQAARVNGGAAGQGEGTDRTEWYGGATRFELELEFVQTLANPYYLHHLSTTKHLDDEAFVAYCKYLQYFAEPRYLHYLSYPGPTLKALELLQQEQFRKDILRPDVVERLATEWMSAANGRRDAEAKAE